MIKKFIEELKSELDRQNVQDNSIISEYEATFDKYIHLGQSEFDIIRHFGEPSDIVSNFVKTGTLNLPDMDEKVAYEMPSYLKPKATEPKAEEPKAEVNNAPTTRAGLIINDIFFVGLGMLVAVAGCIALTVVSVFMTAGSIVQLGAVWDLATKGQQIGGFFMALMCLAISILFYFLVVWIVKLIVKFMKKYVRDHKENWDKCAEQ